VGEPAAARSQGLRVADFLYDLPAERIAQRPVGPRGTSRLMVLDRQSGAPCDAWFRDLPALLRAGDVLVRNDTRVIRARLRGARANGGAVDMLLLRSLSAAKGAEIWSCLAKPGKRLRPGERAEFRGGIRATWLDAGDTDGVRHVRLESQRPVLEMLDEVGELPLPPYIRRDPDEADREAYQTVYARAPGSVAAPTAGLHFTSELLRRLEASGVEPATITLHVGPGTFVPIRTETIADHRMAPERFAVGAETARRLTQAKRDGRRVVAVGTTTVRALEGCAADVLAGRSADGEVSIFIAPGYRFQVVDALITNFHLPGSTLLMLVAAFAGRARILDAYREAIRLGYRFYSYGDAMLIR
jgi:S-adenosylmethionine:tRNA ribosyltransferase-isomerase